MQTECLYVLSNICTFSILFYILSWSLMFIVTLFFSGSSDTIIQIDDRQTDRQIDGRQITVRLQVASVPLCEWLIKYKSTYPYAYCFYIICSSIGYKSSNTRPLILNTYLSSKLGKHSIPFICHFRDFYNFLFIQFSTFRLESFSSVCKTWPAGDKT